MSSRTTRKRSGGVQHAAADEAEEQHAAAAAATAETNGTGRVTRASRSSGGGAALASPALQPITPREREHKRQRLEGAEPQPDAAEEAAAAEVHHTSGDDSDGDATMAPPLPKGSMPPPAAAAAAPLRRRLASVSNPHSSPQGRRSAAYAAPIKTDSDVVDVTESHAAASSSRGRPQLNLEATSGRSSRSHPPVNYREVPESGIVRPPPAPAAASSTRAQRAARGHNNSHHDEQSSGSDRRSTPTPTSRRRDSDTAFIGTQKLTRARAEEMGLSFDQLRKVTGDEEEKSMRRTRHSATASSEPPTPASAAPSEDESVGPRRRSGRQKRITEEDEAADEYRSPDDEESSSSSSEESEASQQYRSSRPRREASNRIGSYAEDKLARDALNRGRMEQSDESDHYSRPQRGEQVMTSYYREIKKDVIRLADGREMSDREYRGALRAGTLNTRVLRDGEEPTLNAAEEGSESNNDAVHEGDVRRSTRARQQVVHYTAGQNSGDEQPEEKQQPRYNRPSAAGRRAGNKNGRRQGGSRRHSDDGRKERRRTNRERQSIQPLHLQIQHAMRRMEAEASGAGINKPSSSRKSKDGRLADIDPIEVDTQVDWGAIGGLDSHIHALKEMVVLPLLYPELFEKFQVQPPKGVLFFGPPGCGKCWAPGTMLMRHDGQAVAVEEVVVGDLLMGDDSTPRIVLPESIIKGHGPMYRISHPSGHRDAWEVNGDHILVLQLNDQPRVEARQDQWAVVHHVVEAGTKMPVERDLKALPTQAAALDALAALLAVWQPLQFECTVLEYLSLDESARLRFVMFQPDLVTFPEPVLSFESRLQSTLGRELKEAEVSDAAQSLGLWLSGCDTQGHSPSTVLPIDLAPSSSFRQLAQSYDLLDRSPHFPSDLLAESVPVRRALLAAVIDGTGELDLASSSYLVASKERALLDGVCHLARGLGLVSSKVVPSQASGFCVTLSGSAFDTLTLITQPHKRHSPIPSSSNEDRCESFRIEPIAAGPYHGFGVSGNGRLLMADYLVTHNTLVARALANTCSATGHKVAFFMRKGSDCLSKYVGEAERQLRLLFEQAHKMQPSIIFFDELDGLAPVRSSRQDQIHASIVSTLLALMDGLDSRGQVIVIGATNRVDSIDPALRRPGRFDRELMFSLPNKQARRTILDIHTKNWAPRPETHFLHSVADLCVGYCGADLRALCTEATLRAVRRKYPQIYLSTDKLAIDVSSIKLKQCDFLDAMRQIVPASHRASNVHARTIPTHLVPLLQPVLDDMILAVKGIFPLGAVSKSAQANGSNIIVDSDDEEQADQEELPEVATTPAGVTLDIAPSSFPLPSAAAVATSTLASAPLAPASSLAALPPRPALPLPLKPRFLLHASGGNMGQSHLGPALLHHFEEFAIFSLDLPLLLGDANAKNAEESCVRIIQECKRNAPAVLYWPHIDLWWSTASESLQNTVLMLLSDLPPNSSIFLFATADCTHAALPEELTTLFPLAGSAASSSPHATSISFEIPRPTAAQLTEFFRPILDELKREIPRMREVTQLQQLPVLPRLKDVLPPAACPAIAQLTPEQEVDHESTLTPAQLNLKLSHEESLIRLQRMSFRNILQVLIGDFPLFEKRVSIDDYSDYYDVIADATSLHDILHGVNEGYDTVTKLLTEIDLLVNNCKEYSGVHDNEFRMTVNQACHLQDSALSMTSQIETKLVQQCEDISKRRAIRKFRFAAATAVTQAAAAANARVTRSTKAEATSGDSTVTSMEIDMPEKAEPAATAPADAAPSAAAVKIETAPASPATDAPVTAAAAETPAASTPAAVAAPASISLVAPPVEAAPAAPLPSPLPSPPPSGALLPPPPSIELNSNSLARLHESLVSTLLGANVDLVELVGFQAMKIVIDHQLKADRNQALAQIDQLRVEHQASSSGPHRSSTQGRR